MKWLREWLIWLGALFKRLFGRRQHEQSSVVPPSYNSTGDLTVPKQLGAGNAPASEQLLREMSEDISHREAALDAKLVDAKIEQMSAEQKLRERELDAKAANEKARLEFEQKQLDIQAEEMRRTQEREDESSRTQQRIQLLQVEQEEARKSNDQAEAFRQKRREEKQQDQAKRAERRAQRWQAFKTSASHILSKLGSGIQFSFRKAWEQLNKKWVKPILGALLIVGFGFWFFQTETGQLWLFGFLGWLEQNQQYVITALGVALLLLLAYRLVRSDRWPAVKASLSALVKRKSFWVSILIIALLGGAFWLYQSGYLSVWIANLLVFLSEVWVYKWYLFVAIAVAAVLAVSFLPRFAGIRSRLGVSKDHLVEKASAIARALSIATGVTAAVVLLFVAIVGILSHSVLITVSALGLLPLCAGLKPSFGFTVRLLVVILFQGLALTLSLVRLN